MVSMDDRALVGYPLLIIQMEAMPQANLTEIWDASWDTLWKMPWNIRLEHALGAHSDTRFG